MGTAKPEPRTRALPDPVPVLVPLSCVPDDHTVTKRTGSYEYTVRRRIMIHGIAPQEIKASEGVVFLVGKSSGSITATDANTVVVWQIPQRDLQLQLDQIEQLEERF